MPGLRWTSRKPYFSSGVGLVFAGVSAHGQVFWAELATLAGWFNASLTLTYTWILHLTTFCQGNAVSSGKKTKLLSREKTKLFRLARKQNFLLSGAKTKLFCLV